MFSCLIFVFNFYLYQWNASAFFLGNRRTIKIIMDLFCVTYGIPNVKLWTPFFKLKIASLKKIYGSKF
jgi:hypothetical protein